MKKPTKQTLEFIEDEPVMPNEYGLVYNMWITNMTINATTVILQTGEPNDPPPPLQPED